MGSSARICLWTNLFGISATQFWHSQFRMSFLSASWMWQLIQTAAPRGSIFSPLLLTLKQTKFFIRISSSVIRQDLSLVHCFWYFSNSNLHSFSPFQQQFHQMVAPQESVFGLLLNTNKQPYSYIIKSMFSPSVLNKLKEAVLQGSVFSPLLWCFSLFLFTILHQANYAPPQQLYSHCSNTASF